MNNIFRNFNFNQLSFWLGFIAASLFWWLLGKLRPSLTRARSATTTRIQQTRSDRRLSDEVRLSNDVLRFAQRWHLAAEIFSLNEILVIPRLLLPPPSPETEGEVATTDITDWAIPYMPDWPQFASFYGSPSVSVVEALQGDANLAIISAPGSGKTVTLAHLASQVSRRDPELGDLVEFVPILVKAADLEFSNEAEELFTPLIRAISTYIDSLKQGRLPSLLGTIFEGNRALLILDGLDELPPQQFKEVTRYLSQILAKFPQTRSVVATSADQLGRLADIGFVPMPLASWDDGQRAAFINRWGSLWNRHITPLSKPDEEAQTEPNAIDPFLLNGWLFNNTNFLSPFELTLKVWGAFAGDLLGPSGMHAIETHLQRKNHGPPPTSRRALEQLSSNMMLSMRPVAKISSAEAWLKGETPKEIEPIDTVTKIDQQEGVQRESAPSERLPLSGVLRDLVDKGLIQEHSGERISISHPVLAGFLASRPINQTQGVSQIDRQPKWDGQTITLQYLAAQDTMAPWVLERLEDESIDPLLDGLLTAATWLGDAPVKAPWSVAVMRKIAAHLQKNTLALGIRARLVTALANSGNQSVSVLLRQMLGSPQDELRQLAVLGAGLLRDTKSVEELINLVNDPIPQVNRAALLALVAIGDRSALDSVAYTLLHGDDNMQQAAAEALTNHPEEGFPVLEEGCYLWFSARRTAMGR